MAETTSSSGPISAEPTADGGIAGRRRLTLEIFIVLGLSLGQSAVYSILTIIDRLTAGPPLSQQTSTLNPSAVPDRPWLDLTYQIAGIVFPLVPVLLALYLLSVTRTTASSRPAGRSIGFDRTRPIFDLGFGALIALCVGVPGLGLYYLAHAIGINTTVQASGLSAHWWTIPVLILAAAENAVLEEVIMIGFLFTRFRQLGWSTALVVISSALIRGSYHLYQGFGGFAGNVIMGIIFGLIYLRWRRVGPLVVAHTILDIVAFIGYTLLAPHVGWL